MRRSVLISPCYPIPWDSMKASMSHIEVPTNLSCKIPNTLIIKSPTKLVPFNYMSGNFLCQCILTLMNQLMGIPISHVKLISFQMELFDKIYCSNLGGNIKMAHLGECHMRWIIASKDHEFMNCWCTNHHEHLRMHHSRNTYSPTSNFHNQILIESNLRNVMPQKYPIIYFAHNLLSWLTSYKDLSYWNMSHYWAGSTLKVYGLSFEFRMVLLQPMRKLHHSCISVPLALIWKWHCILSLTNQAC